MILSPFWARAEHGNGSRHGRTDTIRQFGFKVSRYFLDFLETDFKRQQAPRLSNIFTLLNGLLKYRHSFHEPDA
jgi:hypothetical protein